MEIDPPYRFDPLQNPVNVKWSGAQGESTLGFFEPFFGGAENGPWITSFLQNEAGSVTREFKGKFHFANVADLHTRLLTQPVDEVFRSMNETWHQAYNNYLLNGGPYPKVPYIKAVAP